MARTKPIAARMAGTRRLRRAMAVAALAAAMIAGAAAPAQAGHVWGLTDNFENNPASRWTPFASANGGGHFSDNPQWAHSGSQYAYRWVETGYSSVRRDVYVSTVAAFGYAFCDASIWLRAVTAPVTVNFEIIDPDTWTYVSVRQVSLSPGAGWQQYSIGFTPTEPDLVVRIALLGNGSVTDVRIDDLFMMCEVIQ